MASHVEYKYYVFDARSSTIPLCMVATVTRNAGSVPLLTSTHVTRNAWPVASQYTVRNEGPKIA
jgi:hypothetical protein